MFPQELPALRQGLRMRKDHFYFPLAPAQEAVSNRDVHLGDDHDLQPQEEIHDYCYRSFQAVFNGNNPGLQIAALHGSKDVLEVLQIDKFGFFEAC